MRTKATGTSATSRRWVSLYGVHKALYLVQNDLGFREQMRTDPEGALADLPLTDDERQALATGDVAALYRMGTHTFLMSRLPRFNVPHGLTREKYQRRLRVVLD
jgi:Aromatic-ring-opening dioxygenase LigAB, LigA subunit